jgi:hypothetical protein
MNPRCSIFRPASSLAPERSCVGQKIEASYRGSILVSIPCEARPRCVQWINLSNRAENLQSWRLRFVTKSQGNKTTQCALWQCAGLVKHTKKLEIMAAKLPPR